MSFQPGDRFGDYEVLAVLGAGGMGRVYKVRNIISNRIEAIKVLLPDLAGNPALADRFVREIRVLANLDHPNIAKLYTAQRVENQLLMVMEYVEGVTIEERLQQAGRIPLAEGVGYVRQVLSALAYAHQQGVIHRDIKPANMMLTPDGVVKLMDFGIAKAVTDERLTQTGFTLGSLYYMSPEQVRADPDIDARSDLYSLGISLYEIVTGVKPFQADSQYSLMQAHLEESPRPPLELDPSLPEGLNDIILMAISKEREKRFQTAMAFQRALEAAVPEAAAAPQQAATAAPQEVGAPQPQPTAPSPAPQPAPAAKPRSNRLLYMLAGATAAVALIVVAAIQAPKWFATRAGSDLEPAAVEEAIPEAVPETAPAGEAVPEPLAASPAAQQEPQTAEPAAPPARPAPRPAAASPPATQTSPPPVRPAGSGGQRPAPVKAATGSPTPSRPATAPARAAPPQPARTEAPPPRVAERPPAQPPPPPRNEAELRDLREQLMLMATRVGPVRRSIDTLRRSQEASGLSLRTDIAAAEQRLVYYLDEAETALNSGDAAGGKKYLGLAERELGKLEQFLGR